MGRQRASKVHTAKHSDPNEYARRQVERTLEMIRDKEGQGLMTIKNRLKEYRNLEKEIRELEDEIEVIYTKATSPGKFRLSHEPHGPNREPDKTSDMVADMMDKIERLGECIRSAKEERKAIEELIAPLTPTERRLIRLRYVEGQRWEYVAVELNYSIQWVWKKHGEILSKLGHSNKE